MPTVLQGRGTKFRRVPDHFSHRGATFCVLKVVHNVSRQTRDHVTTDRRPLSAVNAARRLAPAGFL